MHNLFIALIVMVGEVVLGLAVWGGLRFRRHGFKFSLSDPSPSSDSQKVVDLAQRLVDLYLEIKKIRASLPVRSQASLRSLDRAQEACRVMALFLAQGRLPAASGIHSLVDAQFLAVQALLDPVSVPSESEGTSSSIVGSESTADPDFSTEKESAGDSTSPSTDNEPIQEQSTDEASSSLATETTEVLPAE